MSPFVLGSAACLGVLGYTYAGYPLAIAALARLRRAEVASDSGWQPRLSILCSVYNGGPAIEAKLASIEALDYPRELLDVWFYDDGSSDDSAERLAALAATHDWVHVVTGQQRAGKPTALNELAGRAKGEVFLLTDIRQRLSGNSASTLVAALADPTVGCAGGTLALEAEGGDEFAGAGVYWLYERWIRQNESRFRSVVGVSGSLYAIRRDDFPKIPADTILDDLFVPMTVRLAGKRVVLVDEAIAYDVVADDGREFARKARTLAGNYQLFARMPRLLFPLANPSWFETTSHKLMRLACPWALVGLAAFSTAGALTGSPTAIALVAGQGAFYSAAALGPRAGRVGRLARTFVVLNSAAVVGLSRFVRGSQQITW